MSHRGERELQFSHDQQASCTAPGASVHKQEPPHHGVGGKQSKGPEKKVTNGRKFQPSSSGASLHTPTSLAEAGALQAVACLVCSGHQGLGKAAVGKNGAVGRAAQTGPVAGEITLVLGG